MGPLSRRGALRGGLAAVGAALAGCSAERDDRGEGVELVDSASVQTGPRTEPPAWDDGETVGTVLAIDSAERLLPVRERLPERRREAVGEFVDDVRFDEETLLFVETAGPDTCYETVAVEDVGLSAEGDALVATATAAATGSEGCGDAVTYPSALVRATFEGPPVRAATVAVEDGWGERAELTATASDPVGADGRARRGAAAVTPGGGRGSPP